MKRKLLSNLITIVFSLSFITTSFPVQAAEETQTSNTISTNDEEHKFGNRELTEEEKNWKNEHVVDITDKINEELTTKQAKRNFRGALSDDSNIMYKEENGIVDLSKTPYFPEIENQKSMGSCAGFAATYYQMSYAVNKKLNNSLENRIAFCPNFTYNVTNGGTDNGSSIIGNYRFMQKYGCLSIKDHPYNEKDFSSWPTDAETWREAQKYSIADNGIESVDLTSKDNPNYVNIDAVKLLLQKGYILNFSTYMDATVGTNIQVDNTSQYIVYYSNTLFSGPHALTVVGYNDNIDVDINQDGQIEDNEKGALKIANSWGDDDCNNGFFWLSYDALNKVSKVSENTKDTSKNDFINNRKPFFNQNEVTFISDPIINDDAPNLYAKLTLNTNMRARCKVTLSAKNKTTNEVSSYDLDLFEQNKYGFMSFDGSDNEKDGEFIIPLKSVVKNITSKDLNSYYWTLSVSDTVNDSHKLKVKSFSIENNDEPDNNYKADLNDGISLDGSSIDLTFVDLNSKASNTLSATYNMPTINLKDNDKEAELDANIFKYDSSKLYTFILSNNGTESTLAEDTTDSIIKFTPKSSGNYLFKVIVKDPQTKNIINNYNISSSINTFKNGQYLIADSYNINLGDSLKIDTNFNKVDGFYYEFTAASNNGSNVNIYSGNNSSIDWKPNTSGKYLVSVKISNEQGEVITQTTPEPIYVLSNDITTPTNITATGTSIKTITWTPSTSSTKDITGYNIFLNDEYLKTVDSPLLRFPCGNDIYKLNVQAVASDGSTSNISDGVILSNNSLNTYINPISCNYGPVIPIGATANFYSSIFTTDSDLTAKYSIKDKCGNLIKEDTFAGNINWKAEEIGEYTLTVTYTNKNNESISMDKNFTVCNNTALPIKYIKYNNENNVLLDWDASPVDSSIVKYRISCNDEVLGESTYRTFKTLSRYSNFKVEGIDSNNEVVYTYNYFPETFEIESLDFTPSDSNFIYLNTETTCSVKFSKNEAKHLTYTFKLIYKPTEALVSEVTTSSNKFVFTPTEEGMYFIYVTVTDGHITHETKKIIFAQ